MKIISILIHEDAILSAVSGPLDILTTTNRFLQKMGKPAAFKVELVSEKFKNIQLYLPAQFICHKTLADITETDLIIVPAFNGDPDEILKKNRALVTWIKAMNRKGTEVASLCIGSYFLAEAGVLSGKSCTSHWRAIGDMKQRYPEINMLPDAVITDQDGVYTSGGAFSSLNLILYLVEKFCGREVGIQISKNFSIDMDRISQAHFAVFHGQRGHKDEEILKAQTYIEQNYQDKITVDEIAGRTYMSKRNFIRRFKNATHNTPIEYIQRVKVEAAKKSLEATTNSINEIMYEAGYSDPKSFRSVFKRITGLTPVAYREKYNRGAVVL